MKNLILMFLTSLIVSCGQLDADKIKSAANKNSLIGNVEKPIVDKNLPSLPYISDVDEDTYIDETIDEEIAVIEEEVAIVKKLMCDVSNENDFQRIEVIVVTEGEQKKAYLVGEEVGKVTFDGYTLSPSGNQNAAVHHDDMKNLSSEGNVIKISARIFMNDESNEGELQVSYKIQIPRQGTFDTQFARIASINNCLLE